MKVKQIYAKYMIPENLQEHMLRVAGLAEIVCEIWVGEKIDKQAIVAACVFHDIAKPMTFDLSKQAKFGMSAADIAKLEELQKQLKAKYGSDEHQATVGICKDIGLSERAVGLVDDLEWKYIPRLLENNEIESLIPIYADMRIGPKGILPLQERLSELEARAGDEDFAAHDRNGRAVEKLIRENVSIDVNSIEDEQINARFERLLNMEIILNQ